MANRFSQPVQPYVVNPISVDIFSMIPLAKARAKALGIQATESLMFDFDIDKKDAAYSLINLEHFLRLSNYQ